MSGLRLAARMGGNRARMDTEDRDAHLGSRARLDAEAESDKLTAVFSPAQPTGPDRIDDDETAIQLERRTTDLALHTRLVDRPVKDALT